MVGNLPVVAITVQNNVFAAMRGLGQAEIPEKPFFP
jgi:hypothetical protein